ncbi:hypothetical protein LY90DRAFT_668809 [Neocallimastix californiae]|uniref:Uncharacterized protein n=1 Tax=Neocallimastix californiae TaxID=1754190 RepID=A0A1Y2DKR4_9FUNG|nr:hypothetical protein LY90DRAFT_668809 [Neocallimastix californiae]|eukprot:ORY59843.1 hypothetical protein LY90DRAFT_668809 [Neocallimastix californiae]
MMNSSDSETDTSSSSSSSEYDNHRWFRNLLRRYNNPMRHLSMSSSVATSFVYKDKRLADCKISLPLEKKKVKNSKSIETIKNEGSPILNIIDNSIIHPLGNNNSIPVYFQNEEKYVSDSKNVVSSSFEDISTLLKHPPDNKNEELPNKVKHLEKINSERFVQLKNNNDNKNDRKNQYNKGSFSFDSLDSLIKLNQLENSEYSPPTKEYTLPINNNSEIIVNHCIISPSSDNYGKNSKYKEISYKEGKRIKKEIELNKRLKSLKKNNEDLMIEDENNMKNIVIKNQRHFDSIFSDENYEPSTESSTNKTINSIIDAITNRPINKSLLQGHSISQRNKSEDVESAKMNSNPIYSTLDNNRENVVNRENREKINEPVINANAIKNCENKQTDQFFNNSEIPKISNMIREDKRISSSNSDIIIKAQAIKGLGEIDIQEWNKKLENDEYYINKENYEDKIIKKAFSLPITEKNNNNIDSKVDILYSLLYTLRNDYENNQQFNQQFNVDLITDESRKTYTLLNKKVKQIYKEFSYIKHQLLIKNKNDLKTTTFKNQNILIFLK